MLSHYVRRLQLSLQVVEKMELISRTSELARVFGIDFHSVLTRGSQYRVESMLLRLCRSQAYAVASPDKAQVRQQPALTCLPHFLCLPARILLPLGFGPLSGLICCPDPALRPDLLPVHCA